MAVPARPAAAAGTWPLGGAIAPVVCVQNRFGLSDQGHRDVLAACRDRGIAFVPFFAIAGDRKSGGGAGVRLRP